MEPFQNILIQGGITVIYQVVSQQEILINNDIIAAIEMCPSMPDVMIKQASEFLFNELKWPNPPQKQADFAAISYHPQ